ncbi:MAG: peptide chain release factor N(5)-glutamine methyltransferase [Vicinamibacterales bacterium]
MTLRETVAAARHRLTDAGIPPDEAALDARLLAQHLLGWDAARFHAEAAGPAPLSFEQAYPAAVARRTAREPLAYIVGEREFWNLTFEVSRATLIPRPETETLVEAVLELFPDPQRPLSAVDVGTGTGCLAVAIARERPGASVLATDTSREALEVARRNAARHEVSDRVTFVEADLLGERKALLDLIVSNPPYVPEWDRVELQPEVRDYEPAAALFGGPDGLAVIRRLVAEAPRRLRANGALVIEIGAGQAADVAALISSAGGLTMLAARPDLQGIARAIVARRT